VGGFCERERERKKKEKEKGPIFRYLKVAQEHL
jgi:hypothetical protein